MVVIVLGMHRSGTSAVAGALSKLGVEMGDTLLGADENNPLGYYEDVEIAGQNQQILRCAGGTWWNPPTEQALIEVCQVARGMLLHTVARRMKYALWGWKDPRTCLTLPAWMSVLPNQEIKLVRVRRDRDAVVASLLKRHQDDGEWWLKRRTANEWAALVDEYNRRLDSYGLPMVLVSYEHLLADPEKRVGQLARNLGLEVTAEAVAHIRRAE